MSALDATRLLESRFSAIEKHQDELDEDQQVMKTELAVLKHSVADMVDAFKAFRTALYTASGSIIVAAVLIVALGHP